MSTSSSPRLDRRGWIAIVGVGLAQIVGWGSSFFLPSVLGRDFQRDLGISAEIVFAGVTVMFVIGAVTAPAIGKALDRSGARTIMATGSALMGLSVASLALAEGFWSYAASWVAIGFASGFALSSTANVAVTQVAGPAARRAIAFLTVIGGLASTAFWPLTTALDAAVGWRATCVLYGGLHFALCLPIHLLVLPRGRPAIRTSDADGATTMHGTLAPQHRRLAYWLMAGSLATGTLVYNGMALHVIGILRGLGHSDTTAVAIAMLIGPAQMAVRLVEVVFGGRYTMMAAALVASSALPLALSLLLGLGGHAGAALSALALYGVANGLKAIVRTAWPLALFGHEGFGALMGRLAVWQNIASAASPVILAAIIGRFGAEGGLVFGIVAGSIALLGTIGLARHARAR